MNDRMREKQEQGTPQEDSGRKLRRVAALTGVVLLGGLYLVTFVLALFGNEGSARLLRFCFGMTIFVPLFLWVVIWCVGFFRNRRSMASLDILNSDPGERARMEEAAARVMEEREREKIEKSS